MKIMDSLYWCLAKSKFLRWSIPIALFVIVVGASLWGYREYEKNYLEERYETQRTRREYYLTDEEEKAEERKIKEFLASPDVFGGVDTAVRVASGWRDKIDGSTTKTRIVIVIPERLADSEQEAQALSDGYYAAMTLYYGMGKIEEYDVYFSVGLKYEFHNNALQA